MYYNTLYHSRYASTKSITYCGIKMQLTDMSRELLLEVGFMQEDKADHMMQGIQRIFSRGVYTDDDVSIMMGVARQSRWAAKNGNG